MLTICCYGFSHRGQTQSQYLNFPNGPQEGKAEAESTQTGSRATVGECFVILVEFIHL